MSRGGSGSCTTDVTAGDLRPGGLPGDVDRGGGHGAGAPFEQGAPLGLHAPGGLQVVLQQLGDVAGVETGQIGGAHPLLLYQRRTSADPEAD